jgi:phosphoribosylformylglycinamidine (FGAM) synthase PurS component
MSPEDKCLYNAMVNDGIIVEKAPDLMVSSETVIGGSPSQEDVKIEDVKIECADCAKGQCEIHDVHSDKPQTPYRNWETGLMEGVEYKYKANGRIDWEAMFNPEFYIYPKNDTTKEPMLKCDGLLELAELRGVAAKTVKIVPVTQDMIAVEVTMQFSPNIEDPQGKVWSATADATIENVGDKKFAKFLTTMAETRAVGRCIRGALGIRKYTFEEMTKDEVMETEDNGTIKDTALVAIKRQMELKGYKEEGILLKDVSEKEADVIGVSNLASLTVTQGQKVLAFLNKKQNK